MYLSKNFLSAWTELPASGQHLFGTWASTNFSIWRVGMKSYMSGTSGNSVNFDIVCNETRTPHPERSLDHQSSKCRWGEKGWSSRSSYHLLCLRQRDFTFPTAHLSREMFKKTRRCLPPNGKKIGPYMLEHCRKNSGKKVPQGFIASASHPPLRCFPWSATSW